MFSKRSFLNILRSHRFIILLVFFAIVLRLVVGMFYFAPDSILYLKLAEQVQEGKLYVEGIWDESVIDGKLFLSPLYSILIAGIELIIGTWIWSGILVSLLFSIASIIALYYFIRRLFDEKTARIASVIWTVFPLFVKYSTLVLTEALFTFLVIIIAFVTWNLLSRKKAWWKFLFIGLLVGVSYLVRTAGLVGVGVIGIWIVYEFFKNRLARGYYVRVAASFTLGVLLIVIPYVSYVYTQTGLVMISGQQGAVSNFTNLPRVGLFSSMDEMNERWATIFSINEGGEVMVIGGEEADSSLNVGYLVRNAGNMLVILFLGGMPLIIIMAISVVGKERQLILNKRAAYFGLWILLTLLFYSFGKVNFRYLLPVFFILIMFSSRLIVHWGEVWCKKSRARIMIFGVLVALMLVYFYSIGPILQDKYPPVRNMYTYMDGFDYGVAVTEAVEWAQENIPAESSIMAGTAVYSYYTGAQFDILPNGTRAQLTQYLSSSTAEYLIVDSYHDMFVRPITAQIFFGGFDPRITSEMTKEIPYHIIDVGIPSLELVKVFYGEYEDHGEACQRNVLIYRVINKKASIR